MSPSNPPGPRAPVRPVHALHRLAALCAAGTVLFLAPVARSAAPPSGADPEPDPLEVVLDAFRGEQASQDAALGSLTVGVEASLRVSSQERTTFGALAFLQVPLDRLGSPRRRDLVSSPLAEPPGAPAPSPDTAPAGSAPAKAPLLTPDLARGAVRAACQAAKLDEADRRVESLASRARASALLPELRLRATRAIDEGESLAPTEYDPLRRTASAGSSTWLEARATFRLDRLVFADDELAIERLRIAHAAERSRLVAKVLELLDAWQRARAAETDATSADEARGRASLAAVASEASLDVLTGGWFSKAIRAQDAGEARGPGDTRAANETHGGGDDGTRDAKDDVPDAKDRARRAAPRDSGAPDPSRDAPHPSSPERADTRKK